jgi:hypothetical protein
MPQPSASFAQSRIPADHGVPPNIDQDTSPLILRHFDVRCEHVVMIAIPRRALPAAIARVARRPDTMRHILTSLGRSRHRSAVSHQPTNNRQRGAAIVASYPILMRCSCADRTPRAAAAEWLSSKDLDPAAAVPHRERQ